MNFANKVFIIVLLLLKSVAISMIDLLHEYYFPTIRDIETKQDKKIYATFERFKLVLDIPFTILSIYLLLNIKFNPLILTFISLQFIGMFENYYLGRNIFKLNLDKNITYFLAYKLALYINVISLIIGLILLYRILHTEK